MSDDRLPSWLRVVQYAAGGLLLGGALGFLGALVLPRPRADDPHGYHAPVPSRPGASGDAGRRPGDGRDVVLVADDAGGSPATARRDPVVERR